MAIITGTNNDDNLLVGTAGNDVIYGLDGNDTLDGIGGADKMFGGAGDDTFAADNAHDIVNGGDGTDLVQTSVSLLLRDDVENAQMIGQGTSIRLTGNNFDNVITDVTPLAFATAHKVDAGGGNDTITVGKGTENLTGTYDGGAGTDAMSDFGTNNAVFFVVDNTADTVTVGGSGNTDAVASRLIDVDLTNANYSGVDNGQLFGSSGLGLFGNGNVNILTGNTGSNIIDGGAGADNMFGGGGKDTFFIDNVNDHATQTAGTASVIETSNVDIALVLMSTGVNNVTLLGKADLNIFGDLNANILIGNDGDNQIEDGGTGTAPDKLYGGGGDDILVIDNAQAFVSGGDGNDLLITTVSYTIPTDVERVELASVGAPLTLIGNAGDNFITERTAPAFSVGNTILAGAGSDTITVWALSQNLFGTYDGGTGTDVMSDLGTDNTVTFVVDTSADTVTVGGTGNVDIIASSKIDVDLTSANYSGVDDARLLGTGALSLLGNGNVNNLTGNQGSNVIDGGAGADNMFGGGGKDTFFIDNVNDHVTQTGVTASVIETSNVDIGLVTMSTGVNNVTLLGKADLAIFGDLNANILIGNDGDNHIEDGGTGTAPDKLYGGGGDDTLVIDNALAFVSGGDGNDLLITTVSYTIPTDIERVELASVGAPLTLIGNAGDNFITERTGPGFSVGNTILAGAGSDTITVWALAQNLFGTYDGGTGTDVMSDLGTNNTVTFIVDTATDSVTVGGIGNADIVASSKIDVDLTNPNYSGVDIGQLLGSSKLDLLGNGNVNILTGNSGNNIIDGGAGADSLFGGGGTDTFLVDNVNDHVTQTGVTASVIETSNIDIALVLMSTGVNNVTLLGKADLNIFGDLNANILIGNDGDNQIEDGGTGTAPDKLYGSGGNDIIVVDNAKDFVSGGDGNDLLITTVSFTIPTDIESVELASVGAPLTLTGNAGDNFITERTSPAFSVADVVHAGAGNDTITIWALAQNLFGTYDGGTGNDAMSDLGTNNTVTFIVDTAADTVTVGGTGNADIVASSKIDIDLTSASYSGVDSGQLLGSGGLNLSGNGNDNVLTGNSGSNQIGGGAGEDTITGGAGHDMLTGGADADLFVFHTAAAASSDTVTDFDASPGGDVIDIHDVLVGYGGGSVNGFVHLTVTSGNTVISVDANGPAGQGGFVALATLNGVTSFADANAMVTAGHLIV